MSTYQKITQKSFVPLMSKYGQKRIRLPLIVGAILFAILYYLALRFAKPYVERDLFSRVNSVLPHSVEEVSFNAREGILAGLMDSQNQIDQVLDAAKNVWGVRTIENKLFLSESNTQAAAVESDLAQPVIAKEKVLSVVESIKTKGTVSMDNIYFDSGSARINNEDMSVLNEAVDAIKSFSDSTFTIAGHTDNTGTADSNRDLSLSRANAVRNYFVSRGVPEERLSTEGYGASRPIASNDTQDGRKRNRRIEITQNK